MNYFSGYFKERFPLNHGVYFQPGLGDDQTSDYLSLREKEGRIFDDPSALRLPAVTPDHAHFAEWSVRRISQQRLLKNFSTHRELRVVELGCGNGWIARSIRRQGHEVCGVDIHIEELFQAVRLAPDVTFVRGDIFDAAFDQLRCDRIVLAASIQYFPSLPRLLSRLIGLLEPSGEIHIMDSPFYNHQNRAAAQVRSARHFGEMGFPQMTNHYFHHTWDALNGFQIEVRVRRSFWNLLRIPGTTNNPFPWVVVKGKI